MRTIESVLFTVANHGRAITAIILLGSILVVGTGAISATKKVADRLHVTNTTEVLIAMR